MTETNTKETVTVELNVESAYEQLVAHEQAYADYVKTEPDDVQGRLDATVNAVEAAIALINEFIPQEVSDQLHERLEREHPELVQEDPLQALLAQLLAGN